MALRKTEHMDSEENFFAATLADSDPDLAKALEGERDRQQNQIELIASENIASRAVLEANASLLTNKYAEGYPQRRYYGGCQFADDVERLAIARATRLFGCQFANVQPHSGSQANLAVLLALAKPGDTIMGMSLDAGGHLSHGAKPNISGKWFKAVPYAVRRQDDLIDMDEVERLAQQHRPTIIFAGGSAYPRRVDFAAFRKIADQTGALLVADMAHFAGLVAGGAHPSPFPHAHAATTTTHKTLRGPRGGMILANDPAIAKKIDSAIFPGLQGGPLMHIVAAKAAALGEALRPEFKTYAHAVIENARVLGEALIAQGCALIAGGTDTHLLLVDLRPKALTGKDAEESLEAAHITCNKNGVPFDPQPPRITSGIRLGTPAGTTRGFGPAEWTHIGELIGEVLDGLARHGPGNNRETETRVRQKALALCARFPIYGRA